MNDLQDILPRHAGMSISRQLAVHPAVILMGARQTGKSTLVQAHPALTRHRYVTLDDLAFRELATSSPRDLVRLADQMTIDEVQRAPEVIIAVKQAIDEDRPRQKGRFALTGSANLLLMRGVSESLAGRAGYVTMWPLTRRERLGRGTAGAWTALVEAPFVRWRKIVADASAGRASWRLEASRGGYPVPAHELDSAEDRFLWFDGYVSTYLERDLKDLAAVESLVDFQRFMRAVCSRVGNLANQTDIARDIGVSQPTIHRWLNLLETSFQLIRLEPYSVNRTKRLVKSPKLYWSDTGLALHLAGGEPSGAHLENLVLMDLVAWREGLVPRPEVLFWRASTGEEVDFVIELPRGGRLLAIEVKTTRRPGPRDAANLRTFRDDYRDRFLGGLLLHDGEEILSMGEGVLAVPWWMLV